MTEVGKEKPTAMEWIIVLVFAFLLAGGVAWLTNFLFFDPQIIVGLTNNMMTFDSQLWKTNQHREDMVASLIITRQLIGLTHDQVRELLGWEETPKSFEGDSYCLGKKYKYRLLVIYDKNKRVSQVGIRYCGS